MSQSFLTQPKSWIRSTLIWAALFFLPLLFLTGIYVTLEFVSYKLLCNQDDCETYSGRHWISSSTYTSVDHRGENKIRDPIGLNMFLGWDFSPNKIFWGLDVDQNGYIATAFKTEMHSGYPKVLLIGGSTVAGSGATSNEFTIASQLQNKLNDKGIKLDVVNVGVGGWFSRNELAFLVHKLPFIKNVKTVVLIDGYNDLMRTSLFGEGYDWLLTDSQRNRKLRELENGDIWVAFKHLISTIINSTKFFDLKNHYTGMLLTKSGGLIRELKSNDSTALINFKCNNQFSVNSSFYIRNIISSEKIAIQNNVDFYHFLQPLVYGKKNLSENEIQPLNIIQERLSNTNWYNLKGKCFKDLERKFANTYRNEFDRSNINYYDISELFDNSKDDIFYDYAHYTNLGNKKIAGEIFNSIFTK